MRVTADLRSEQIGGKIRLSETEKIPYMVILGAKEVENNHVSLRRHKIGDIGSVPKYQFKADLIKEITEKHLLRALNLAKQAIIYFTNTYFIYLEINLII